MTAYAWLIFAAIIASLALLPLTYVVQDWAARNVARMVDDGLAILATTDDDFDEYADPDPFDWSADTLHAWADCTTPTFRDPCANNPAAVDALAAAEFARFDPDAADWSRP